MVLSILSTSVWIAFQIRMQSFLIAHTPVNILSFFVFVFCMGLYSFGFYTFVKDEMEEQYNDLQFLADLQIDEIIRRV